MIIERNIYKKLLSWKHSENRKPLLLRGARQTGKTTIVRSFSKEFKNYVELNLEKQSDRSFFEKTDDINQVLNAIFLSRGLPLESNSSLLFIDEIQESPQAIHLLRYLYEVKPELHVIAAGSLLEFALNKVPAFPVGRIENMCLHPVNFDEFLGVANAEAQKLLHRVPVDDYAHETLMSLFHEYALVGGMPGILAAYFENKNLSLLTEKYKNLWQNFKDDVEKYARNHTERNIMRHVIEAAPKETDRVSFAGFGASNYGSREVGESLRALDMAGIIRLIYPATTISPPLIANMKKKPRLQFIDTGMLLNILHLQGDIIGIRNLCDFYRGKFIHHLVGQELMSVYNDTLYRPLFWVREKKESNAEMDMVFQYKKYVLPVEIKSGKDGTLRSLHQFVAEAGHPFAIRLYDGNFNIHETQTPAGKRYILMNLPYYLGEMIPQYAEYFIKNFR